MDIKAKKSLGQNFLKDKNIAYKIAESLQIEKNDLVVEIGPGTGVLTEQLLKFTDNLILIEIDRRAIEILHDKFFNYPSIEIINQDIKNYDFNNAFKKNSDQRILLIGNIPYYLTGLIFSRVFDNSHLIRRAVFTIQKEVALRLTAKINNKDYSILTIAANFSGETEKLFDIPAEFFSPKPKVDSAVIRHIFHDNFDKVKFDKLMSVVKRTYNQRRKMLSNTLKGSISDENHPKWIKYKNLRPENLTIDDFFEIINLMKSKDEQLKK